MAALPPPTTPTTTTIVAAWPPESSVAPQPPVTLPRTGPDGTTGAIQIATALLVGGALLLFAARRPEQGVGRR